MSGESDSKQKEKYLNDLQWVVSTPQGRRFIWAILERCSAFKDKYYEETNYTYFRKGQRNIGLQLFNDVLDVSPNIYSQMKQERDSQETRENIKQEKHIKSKEKNPTKINSSSLPNTEREMGKGDG